MNPLRLLLICFAGWLNHRQQLVIEYLQEEIRVLQEQLGRRPRFNDNQRRRLAAKGKPIGRKGLVRLASIVTPDTLLAWHRRLIAQKYDSSKKRYPGRPPTAANIRELVLRMARENPSWGYTRIQGALANLRHEIGRGTIATTLREAGLDPSPDRRNGMPWKEFLRIHWSTCLDRIILIGESSLRGAVREFDSHYHTERNHQGLENKISLATFSWLPASPDISHAD